MLYQLILFLDPVPDATGVWIDAIHWPLENFCARLYVDLFNAKWEVRHGAATALRELINQQASGAGKSLNMTREEVSLKVYEKSIEIIF